jgi:hypothetical protein
MPHKKLIGALVVTAAVATGPSAAHASLPAIGPVQHGELKWVLPPDNDWSLAYDNVRDGHEGTGGVGAMGYETVEHDDLTYDPTARP